MLVRLTLLLGTLLWAFGAQAETIKNAQGMEFIKLPAGSFTMGCHEGEECQDDEKPAVARTIDHAFWLGKTEVTQAQWQAVMGNNPSHFKGDDKRPVEMVDYASAQAFADALSEDEGCDHCYRLPTEEEWEYAARLDGATLRNAVFGDKDNGVETTEPVCSRKPGKLGLCDMLGNVWEWTSSFYTEDFNPDTARQESRVLRGACWSNSAPYVRLGNRDDVAPEKRFDDLGFRLVKISP